MHNYLTHLIADLRQAAKDLPVKPYYDIPPEAEGIEYVVEWENAKAKPMQEWFGIDKKNFPPPEKLTGDELKMMVDEILKLWEAYNFYADLPEDLPAEIAYKVLVDFFEKPVAWVSEGSSHIEFCEYEPENCPFPPEYCWCKNFEARESQAGSLPRTENAGEIAILSKEIADIEDSRKEAFSPVYYKMERYVEQLINDLHTAAAKFLQRQIIPETTEDRGLEDTRQLIENPYLTLEELTSIEVAVFPEHKDMDGLHTRKVLRAMLQLLDACYLKVYFPDEAPHEIKYEALREYWDVYQVKHLPLSGDDIELCTGDPMTCPFGEYCYCNDDEDLSDDEPPGPSKESLPENDELPF